MEEDDLTEVHRQEEHEHMSSCRDHMSDAFLCASTCLSTSFPARTKIPPMFSCRELFQKKPNTSKNKTCVDTLALGRKQGVHSLALGRKTCVHTFLRCFMAPKRLCMQDFVQTLSDRLRMSVDSTERRPSHFVVYAAHVVDSVWAFVLHQLARRRCQCDAVRFRFSIYR